MSPLSPSRLVFFIQCSGDLPSFHSFPTRRSSDLSRAVLTGLLREEIGFDGLVVTDCLEMRGIADHWGPEETALLALEAGADRSEEHTSELQSPMYLVCRLLLEKKKAPYNPIEPGS